MTLEEQILNIKTIFSDADLSLSDRQARQFVRYYELLVQKNEVMNLTAITEFHEVVVKHFLDSCLLWRYLSEEPVTSVIDVGTGAGFPGVPLKILRPEVRLQLLDALRKRVDFLEEVGAALDLRDVVFEHGRAEDSAKQNREGFSLAVSRAVSRLNVLSEYCLPFVKVEGLFTAYKSAEIEDELAEAERAIRELGGQLERIEKFSLPDGSQRSIVFIRKVAETPKKYPRKAGRPMKAPL